MQKRRYITTAIDYPNAAPHMGHVLEKVIADVLARYYRLQGEEVRFQIGTDEHGIKIQQTAEKQGITPEELTDINVRLFEELYTQLNISADQFLRTSDRSVSWKNIAPYNHKKTTEEMWKRLVDANVLEKRSYMGLYCSGCERFLTPKDLVDGKCPDHDREPEKVEEENYFLMLSKETEWLQKVLKDTYHILPSYRAEETLALLDRGLEDVSFSRPKSSLQWGIPVPGDEEQTMYVWCDALTNYLSGIDYFDVAGNKRDDLWDDAHITHVIGKDIARFHALIWPAMLKAADVRLPDELLMHGFITNEGKKMSKSLGNVVNPVDVLDRFKGNPDPLRFFLCHEVPVGRDGDFSMQRMEEMYQAVLGNKLGNLLNRVLILMKKNSLSIPDTIPHPTDSHKSVVVKWKHYNDSIVGFNLNDAIQHAMDIVEFGNQMMQTHTVWNHEQKDQFLAEFCESIRHVALMLLPFMPDAAYRMSKQLNVPYAEDMRKNDFVITPAMKQWGGAEGWNTVGEPEILFLPLE